MAQKDTMAYNEVLVLGVNKVNLLYVYKYPLFFRFFSHIGHYGILKRVSCVICNSTLVIQPRKP